LTVKLLILVAIKSKETFDRTMMQALELLCLVKGMSWDKAMLNIEEMKPVTLAIVELCLSGDIS